MSPAGWIRAAPPDDPVSGRRVAAAVQTAAHYRHDQRRMAQLVRRLFETLVGGDIFVKTELVCNRQPAPETNGRHDPRRRQIPLSDCQGHSLAENNALSILNRS